MLILAIGFFEIAGVSEPIVFPFFMLGVLLDILPQILRQSGFLVLTSGMLQIDYSSHVSLALFKYPLSSLSSTSFFLKKVSCSFLYLALF
jgi:hypothetical protein